jgi:hypothetical protein
MLNRLPNTVTKDTTFSLFSCKESFALYMDSSNGNHLVCLLSVSFSSGETENQHFLPIALLQ